MPLPHHKRALGAQHVLLPPDLPHVITWDRAPSLVGGFDFGELECACLAQREAVGRREVPHIGLGVKQRPARLDAVLAQHPGRDNRLALGAVAGKGVAGEARAVQLLPRRGVDRPGGRELCHVGCGDAARSSAHPLPAVAPVGHDSAQVVWQCGIHRSLLCHRDNGVMTSEQAVATNERPLRVLLVDDEPSISQMLSMALRYDGWQVEVAANGTEAVDLAEAFMPDVMVLDIMLPDFDGMQVLARLRSRGDLVPVLFLTALGSVDDRVKGLTAGGDDYMVKPFSIEELVARLRALVRRSRLQLDRTPDPVLRVGDLTLNEDSYEVARAGEPIELTSTEFELLRFFMRNERRVLSKVQILDRVWSYDYSGKQTVVELYVSYLRKKIDAGREPMLHTVRGAGYVLKPAG